VNRNRLKTTAHSDSKGITFCALAIAAGYCCAQPYDCPAIGYNDETMSTVPQPFRFTPSAYPIQFDCNAVEESDFKNVQSAIEQEYMDANSWKRLHCRNARKDNNIESLFVLELDHIVEFDWSWEGAQAFCPIKMDAIGLQESWVHDSYLWSGQIIEFDEANNRLYILADGEPHEGEFLVRPFEFLRNLNDIYNGDAFQEQERLEGFGLTIHQRLKGRLTAALGLADQNWNIIWGPPGTGKTYTTAQQIADTLNAEQWIDTDALAEDCLPHERILVVSTTNRAVDSIAAAIGRAGQGSEKTRRFLDEHRMVRIGKGAKHSTFESENLLDMLYGTDTGLLKQLESLEKELHRLTDSEQKSALKIEIIKVKAEMREALRRNFLDAKNSVVVCTAFTALRMITHPDTQVDLEQGRAPFTTIFIDEAGLISRAVCAALSLLASRNVVLVGDSKQLSPISRMSRLLPPNKEKWVASSGLAHLDDCRSDALPKKVNFLNTQYRMHPEIGEVVSQYLYGGELRHADGLAQRPFALSGNLLEPSPRAVWSVLDAEVQELSSIRADRGPGNKSWVRHATKEILDKLFSDSAFAKAQGLFISPFTAQAKAIQQYLAQKRFDTWSASTVHSQQGQEADIIIFDTVNAGSNGWSLKEWRRMINVGLSRAREMVILLASRDEMREAFLSPLIETMKPRTISVRNGHLTWHEVDEQKFPLGWYQPDAAQKEALRKMESLPPETLGRQIAERTVLYPVLSQEQQELCGYKIDGKPRLVRGVAGSGKTTVLAEWLVQCLNVRQAEGTKNHLPFWVVFGNSTLEKLLKGTVENAWRRQNGNKSFPYNKEVQYIPVWEVLKSLANEFGLPYASAESYHWNYDQRSLEIIDAVGSKQVVSCCDALFLDEAQDMGQNTLKLLFSLVHPSEGGREFDKPICIFYDNAQNVYNKSGMPKWSELGLDIRGRSRIMKESFRSTRVISEYAINVLYHLKPEELGADHKELADQHLLIKRNGMDWWEVHFNQIGGPYPEFTEYMSVNEEFTELGEKLKRLLEEEYVSPKDICILCNNKNKIEPLLKQFVEPFLPPPYSLLLFPKAGHRRCETEILAATPHSFKGYDAEIVFIPAADSFVAKESGRYDILANPLYVAMTRARSMLTISATKSEGEPSQRICNVLWSCLRDLKQGAEPQS
jgi:superfamily I DNA/RNA helicase